ncbi:hypothetical protein KUTeg_002926 [Tegillarca granosa]|uniref:EF-hand domain-containing protein n=1 Tax=Tegillarca granosa TaxID=220873 RepID=A0ABQ9FQ32_TEGGR|nr:hypothetical protein KUTeg_002926 [Tegillarca granosa]
MQTHHNPLDQIPEDSAHAQYAFFSGIPDCWRDKNFRRFYLGFVKQNGINHLYKNERLEIRSEFKVTEKQFTGKCCRMATDGIRSIDGTGLGWGSRLVKFNIKPRYKIPINYTVYFSLWDDAHNTFNLFDKKGAGCVNSNELGNVFKSLALHVEDEKLKRWADEKDEDAKYNYFLNHSIQAQNSRTKGFQLGKILNLMTFYKIVKIGRIKNKKLHRGIKH